MDSLLKAARPVAAERAATGLDNLEVKEQSVSGWERSDIIK